MEHSLTMEIIKIESGLIVLILILMEHSLTVLSVMILAVSNLS